MAHSSLQPALVVVILAFDLLIFLNRERAPSQPALPSGTPPPGSSFGNRVKNMIRNWMLLLQRVVIPSLVFPKEHYSDEWRWDRKLFFQTFYTNMTKSINISCETVSIASRPCAAYYGVRNGLSLAVEAQDTFAKSQSIDAFPVIERFPWLRYMPSWFPGCDFGKVAAQCFEKDKIIDTVPFEMAMNRSHSIAYLSRNPDFKLGNLIIVELAEQNEGNYTAIETQSEEWECSFLQAMTPHTDNTEERAIKIDRVIDQDRLPIFEDRRSSLPKYTRIQMSLCPSRDLDQEDPSRISTRCVWIQTKPDDRGGNFSEIALAGKAKDEQGTLETDIPEEFIGVLPRHSKPYQYSTRRNQDAKEVIMATSLTQPLHSSMVKSQNYCFYQLFYESSDSSVWTYAVVPGLDHLS
ncbi:hypothetical protein GGU11DRAFT_756792 [Lentinula aff. detonsa]|uniref:Uncharacterized protein n=1 Tax=Lentinula aff. detonsa TaxID=2804958 RepID=A0AA38NJQ3_9AGAR|nr:hypothetical protein GGU10DRAFT_336027 [Lentinula aff. detonsa]KAJ3797342.1 hypothetical protein GGU11DRAFT_756792 [Lentinula aff. detonsa]